MTHRSHEPTCPVPVLTWFCWADRDSVHEIRFHSCTSSVIHGGRVNVSARRFLAPFWKHVVPMDVWQSNVCDDPAFSIRCLNLLELTTERGWSFR